jgi:stage V sporulation protein AD
MYGLYGACSTCGEALSLAAMSIAGGMADSCVCVTSSHFASAEKEFRFPLDYGSQRPLSASWTVTGSGAFVLADEEYAFRWTKEQEKKRESGNTCHPRARITGLTTGKIVDFGLKDSMNMGACMAPAAAATIRQHFLDFDSGPEDYDKIITGDLGKVGQKVLFDLMKGEGWDISSRHMDCGIEIYDGEAQDTHAGGSGCGCCAVTLSAYILRQLEEKNWKRVLFAPTGALLSRISFNEGKSVPGIAHAVVIEAADN